MGMEKSAAEIMDGLFFIERGYLNANHFVFRGEAPVLIDTGYIGDYEDTLRLMTHLDVDLSRTKSIICTHCHCDHIGGNRLIQEKSGCDIACHTIGKYFMDARDDWSPLWRYYNQEADFFSCTTALKDQDIIHAGPHEFKVIHTPGHASDGIVLYNEKEKILLTSDTLWEKGVAVMTLRVEGSVALFRMAESLDKISSLDVKTVYPGHGKPFTDFNQAIADSRRLIQTYIWDRDVLGNDLIKKIMVYSLLMKKAIGENDFLPYLMETYWFKETVDLYFNGEYETKYNEIMNRFLKSGVVKRENNSFYTTIRA